MTAQRALPGWAIDLIREGVPAVDLGRGGDRAVWGAARRTALSAIQKDWGCAAWVDLVLEPRSLLGRQVRLKGGYKDRGHLNAVRTLHTAWAAAEKWLQEAPPRWTREDAIAWVRSVRDWVADPDAPLSDAERAVLMHACETGITNGTDRPALPWRAVVEGTGLTEKVTKITIKRLQARGLLRLGIRGKYSKDPGRRRANCYKLPDQQCMDSTYQYRETRSMGPSPLIYGTPAPEDVGTSPQSPSAEQPLIYGTPGSEPSTSTDHQEVPGDSTADHSANTAGPFVAPQQTQETRQGQTASAEIGVSSAEIDALLGVTVEKPAGPGRSNQRRRALTTA